MAKFVVSLNSTQYMLVRKDARIMVIGEIEYARRLLGPPDDEDSDSSTLVPETVRKEVPIVPLCLRRLLDDLKRLNHPLTFVNSASIF